MTSMALGGARALAALALACIVAWSAPAAAQARPQAVLDLRNLMTPAEYRAAGLERLSAEERAQLNDWVGRMVQRLMGSRQPTCASPIASRIDGAFDGWTGGTVVALQNGQVWRQRSGGRRAGGGSSPGVRIYRSGAGCKLRVDGMDGDVFVERVR